MAYYDVTNITNATNFADTFITTNTMTGGGFAAFILFAIFIMAFLAMKRYDTRDVFVVSSFITLLIGGIFFFYSVIGWGIFGTLLGLQAISILVAIFTD